MWDLATLIVLNERREQELKDWPDEPARGASCDEEGTLYVNEDGQPE